MIHSIRGPATTLVEFYLDGIRPVSELEIIDFRIWWSGVQIVAGGIAGVSTEEEHRGRGYARECMEYASKVQRHEGKLLSILFGIPHFYERFGYAVVMPWYGAYVPLETRRDIPPEPAMENFRAQHQNAILNMYRDAVGLRIGPAVRDPSVQVNLRKPTRWRTRGMMRVLTDLGGEARGYVCHSEPGTEEFEVVEVCATSNAVYEQLLAYLLHETKRRGKDRFVAALPPDDPFSPLLRRYDAQFVVATRGTGGGMARIVHFKEICSEIQPVFQRRVKLLRREFVPKCLTISTEEGEGVIQFDGSAPPAKIDAPLSLVTQFLFGYISLADAFRAGASGSIASGLGELLFPMAHPFMYLRDRF